MVTPPAILGTVRRAGRRDRVERLAAGAVADRMEVNLDPGRIEPGHGPAHEIGVVEADPAIVARAAVPVAIRLEKRPGVVLEHPVDHDLHRAGVEAADRTGSSPLEQLVDL